MKKQLLLANILFLFAFPVMAGGGLDDFIQNVNIQARADIVNFSAKVGIQFGVSESEVMMVLTTVRVPADAFMVFQLGQMAHQQPESVMQVYQKQKGHNWGNIAKEIGIKPGSPEFHALKSGDLHFKNEGTVQHNSGPGNGKSKGKKNRD
jgi:hypothetical protein